MNTDIMSIIYKYDSDCEFYLACGFTARMESSTMTTLSRNDSEPI